MPVAILTTFSAGK